MGKLKSFSEGVSTGSNYETQIVSQRLKKKFKEIEDEIIWEPSDKHRTAEREELTKGINSLRELKNLEEKEYADPADKEFIKRLKILRSGGITKKPLKGVGPLAGGGLIRPRDSIKILQTLRKGKMIIPDFRSTVGRKDLIITKAVFTHARKTAKWFLTGPNAPELSPGTYKNLKQLIKIKYPTGKMTETAAKPLAKLVAVEYAKKKGIKISAGLIKKFIPWIGWGIVVGDLVRRAMKKKDFGEYYHKDVGWY